jgi:hypothetical protein
MATPQPRAPSLGHRRTLAFLLKIFDDKLSIALTNMRPVTSGGVPSFEAWRIGVFTKE